MDESKELLTLLQEITALTSQFLSNEQSCVDGEGVISPLLDNILKMRDKAADILRRQPDLKSELLKVPNFGSMNDELGKKMSKEMDLIHDKIMKRNKSKHAINSYTQRDGLNKTPLFFDDLG